MAIARIRHARLWDAYFDSGHLASPVLTFGVDDIRLPAYATEDSPLAALRRLATTGRAGALPERFRQATLHEMFANDGGYTVDCVDLFDARASWRWDMNVPIDADRHGQYGTVVDIGSSEHVFDTRICLENIIRLLRVGGWYLAHLPVNGYFAHGLHTFNPRLIVDALQLNGFCVTEIRYTDVKGRLVRNPGRTRDCLMWLAANKIASTGKLTIPQQSFWQAFYDGPDRKTAVRIQQDYWDEVGRTRVHDEERGTVRD